MPNPKKITAIVGSYRKGGIIDSAVDEILAGARERGAETSKIFLADRRIEYCTNCRSCAEEPGEQRGRCVLSDDLGGILDQVEQSDGLVLASPMNFYTVTAVMKCFMERLICYAFWPWGTRGGPKFRIRNLTKRAVIVGSSGAPGFVIRPLTNLVSLLRTTAKALGAKTQGVLFIGLAAVDKNQRLTDGARNKARRMGHLLIVL
jgi:NAD(P)H-dependent FMN reductase